MPHHHQHSTLKIKPIIRTEKKAKNINEQNWKRHLLNIKTTESFERNKTKTIFLVLFFLLKLFGCFTTLVLCNYIKLLLINDACNHWTQQMILESVALIIMVREREYLSIQPFKRYKCLLVANNFLLLSSNCQLKTENYYMCFIDCG